MDEQELEVWRSRIRSQQVQFRAAVGPVKLALLHMASGLLSRLRPGLSRGGKTGSQPPDSNDSRHMTWQLPWLPVWPRLASRPVHDPADFGWVQKLERSAPLIRQELQQVLNHFERARYDSKTNTKPWQAYYFYLGGKPVGSHLDDCPHTRAMLQEIPHNGLHVCFSAVPAGGWINPHTGPTNTSLTAHLGLIDCEGSRLMVADQTLTYRNDSVLVFDDSHVHWVENHSQHTRYTLMITFWHPQLSSLERGLLARLARGLA